MKRNAYLNGQDILNWYKTPDQMKFTDKGFPVLDPLFDLPEDVSLIPFNYALSSDNKDHYVHFYIQDYMFNRIWNSPQRYIDVLKVYKGIVMPDFSMYTDMPEPLQMFNHYRNLWFARMCQIQGITVIPSPNWSTKRSFDWCFDGLPRESIIMLSTVGSLKNLEAQKYFVSGVERMQEVLKPKEILVRTTRKSWPMVKPLLHGICRFIDYTV